MTTERPASSNSAAHATAAGPEPRTQSNAPAKLLTNNDHTKARASCRIVATQQHYHRNLGLTSGLAERSAALRHDPRISSAAGLAKHENERAWTCGCPSAHGPAQNLLPFEPDVPVRVAHRWHREFSRGRIAITGVVMLLSGYLWSCRDQPTERSDDGRTQ